MDIEESPARFKVVVAGRRVGKTTYGVRKCVKEALITGGLYFWIAPSYKVAEVGWRMLKRLCWQLPGVEIREADKSVILENGGRIDIRSAVDPDSLRGEKLWGAVFDEFAQIRPETWPEVIRPALSDVKGWALFIGTPKGHNWAFDLFNMALVTPGWAAFRKPTSANPYIDPQEIELARNDPSMSELMFLQEYEADFGASQYQVFPEILPQLHTWKGTVPEFVGYYGGMDFGGDTVGAHKSTTVIGGLTSNDELIVIAAFKQSGPNIAERQLNWTFEQEHVLADIHRKLGQRPPAVIYRADKSQMVSIQLMKRMGLNVYPTLGGPDSVEAGIEAVHRRLKVREDGRPRLFVYPGVPNVLTDLQTYHYAEPKTDGSVQKKNPMKVDDDLVDAVRYMVESLDRAVVGNPHEMYRKLIPSVGS